MHILTLTEVTYTMSPVYTTLDYGYIHETKVLIRFWYLESVVCRNETKNTTKLNRKSRTYDALYLIFYIGLTLLPAYYY